MLNAIFAGSIWLSFGIIGVVITEYVEWRYGNWIMLPTKKNGASFKKALLECPWGFALLGPFFLLISILITLAKLFNFIMVTLINSLMKD